MSSLILIFFIDTHSNPIFLYAYQAIIPKLISESNHLLILIYIGIHNGNKMTPTLMTKYQNDFKIPVVCPCWQMTARNLSKILSPASIKWPKWPFSVFLFSVFKESIKYWNKQRKGKGSTSTQPTQTSFNSRDNLFTRFFPWTPH